MLSSFPDNIKDIDLVCGSKNRESCNWGNWIYGYRISDQRLKQSSLLIGVNSLSLRMIRDSTPLVSCLRIQFYIFYSNTVGWCL